MNVTNATQKPKKQTTLRRFLAGYLLRTGLFLGELILVWGMLFVVLTEENAFHFVYLANAGSTAAQEGKRLTSSMTAETFAPETFPDLCRYLLVDTRSDGQNATLATNLTGRHLKDAQNALAGGSSSLLFYTQYYLNAPLADGTTCLFQFDYKVEYVNPALRGNLPDFQLVFFVGFFVACGLVIWLETRRVGSILQRDTALLTAESTRLAAGNVSAATGDAPTNPPRLKEYAAALQTMEDLRGELAASLQAQWAMEQCRTEQIAALTHDLKTPLTVIGGNAELLAEEPLTPAQQQCVEAILRGQTRARQYMDRLRAVAGAGLGGQQKPARLPVTLATFAADIAKDAANLCRPKAIDFSLSGPENLSGLVFFADAAALTRALLNLLENAVRYTPEGGQITLTITAGKTLQFVVTDGGPGFSAEALQKAGQLFYTEDAARTGQGHQGLGVYYARQVAKSHGGRLKVVNTGAGGQVYLEIALSPT